MATLAQADAGGPVDQLLNVLSASWDRPLGFVGVVGAGDKRTLDLVRLAALSQWHLVLVEADPITAAALERHIERLDWVNVRATPITVMGLDATLPGYQVA